MQTYLMPLCYLPSSVLLLDDDRGFLAQVAQQFGDKALWQVVDTPFDAIELLKNAACKPDSAFNHGHLPQYSQAESGAFIRQLLDINLASLHNEVYNAQRFAEVSVVIADHAMLTMNGITFFENITKSSVKKILLIEHADESRAKQAITDGLIDKYIVKPSTSLPFLICKAIVELQKAYFQDISKQLSQPFIDALPSCLFEVAFVRFFDDLLAQHQIIEYYLMSHSGQFLLLDKNGATSFLTIISEQQRQAYYQQARDQGLSQQQLEALQQGKKIPLYLTELQEWNDWSMYLVDADSLNGQQRYYYALSKAHSLFDIRADKISSYDDFHMEAVSRV